MSSFITTAILGAFCVILGIFNMRGNIASIHWYHRQRVIEEDRRPFGKLVGLGTIVIGVSLVLFGALSFAADQTGNDALRLAGTVILIISIAVALGLSFFAMIKYNKGIF